MSNILSLQLFILTLSVSVGHDLVSHVTDAEVLEAEDECSVDDNSCSLSLRQLRLRAHGPIGCDRASGGLCPGGIECPVSGWCPMQGEVRAASAGPQPPAAEHHSNIGCDHAGGGLCPGGIACPASGWCPDTLSAPRNLAPMGPPPERRLKIVNGCNKPMWIAHIVAGRMGPDPQDVKLEPGASFEFKTGDGANGYSATRFWPKLGCDAAGNNCAVGDSGGPGEGCVIRGPGMPDDYSHCAPPIDTKFEATFASASAHRDKDVVDMSLVDGYTLPFKMEVEGTCSISGRPFDGMDCSGIAKECPTNEYIVGSGLFDLHAKKPGSNEHAGCYSPCMRLTDDKWGHPIGSPSSPIAAPYCCAGSMGTPGACNPGPISRSMYINELHKSCPQAYAYAYDDRRATVACDSHTMYTVTFFCN